MISVAVLQYLMDNNILPPKEVGWVDCSSDNRRKCQYYSEVIWHGLF